MLFSLLLAFLDLALKITSKTNKSVKEMISIRDLVYVIRTKDEKRGKRFIFKGKYSSDKTFKDYNLALVFKDASTGFKTLAFGGESGIQDAVNNWDLQLVGDATILNFIGVMFMISLGAMKRK